MLPASLHPSFYSLHWTGRTPFLPQCGQLSAFSELLPKTWKFLRIENSQVVISLRERQLAEDWSQRCPEAKVHQGGSWVRYSEMSFFVASGPCGLIKRGDPGPSWWEHLVLLLKTDIPRLHHQLTPRWETDGPTEGWLASLRMSTHPRKYSPVTLPFKLCHLYVPGHKGSPVVWIRISLEQLKTKSSDSHSTSTLSNMGQSYSATRIKKQLKRPLGEMEWATTPLISWISLIWFQ